MCAECRGEREDAHPGAAIYGRKGKIERFYWREIFKTCCEYVLDWLQKDSEQVKDIIDFRTRFPEKAKELEKKAKKYWQTVHRQNPKYDLKERTQAEFLSMIQVPVRKIKAEYRQVPKGDQKIGKWENSAGRLVSVEEIATEWYQSKGYKVLRCEKTLISIWVATFLAQAIQDPQDPRVRQTFRGSTKSWTPRNRNTQLISILLPEDFGSAEHYKRRKDAIQTCIQHMRNTENLQILFDKLLDDSESLRDYLWVNEDKDVEISRTALNVLPKEIIIASVEWAIQDFWPRQPGWPDLFVYNDSGFKFSEVKSPHDELSQEQMNWHQWAVNEANIPSEILRVYKRKK